MVLGHYFQLCIILLLLGKCVPEQDDTLLEQYLQPGNADEQDFLYDGNENNVSCTRECMEGSPPRTCYFSWVLEQYSTLNIACGNCPENITDCFNHGCVTGNGYERVILTVNRKMPGPSIQVCLRDRVIVDVINTMPGKETTIHWHGLHLKGEPYMDGVPMVTQCSIRSHQTFRYDFIANNTGTFFWHSHDGFQKVDGLAGSLIVREPRSMDSNSHLYDYDQPNHVMMIMDWYHIDADTHFPGLLTHDVSQDADAYLIGGRGRNSETSNGLKYPLSIFRVSKSKKYRFRLIGSLCTQCPVRIKFEDHQMLVIATDGKPIEPILVDTVVLEAGIRFDVVIHANKKKGSYWIRAQALAQCAWIDVQQLAILQYEGSDTTEPTTEPIYMPYIPPSAELNAENATCGPGEHGICIHQLTGKTNLPADLMKGKPDVNLVLNISMHYYEIHELLDNYYRYQQTGTRNRQLGGEINKISSILPPSPLLSQEEDVPSDVFCPTSSGGTPYCDTDFCHCLHVIDIPLGAVVQMFLVDHSIVGSVNHPFHLHGYSFAVLETGNTTDPEHLEQLLQEYNSKQLNKTHKPPFVDTLAVPSQGYAVVRFIADNPGYWLLHCHVANHQETGMFTILKTGNKSQFPAVPNGFPRCEDYRPKFSPK